MEQIATIVLPVFGIIGVGYLVAGLFSAATGDAISDFVFTVPIPMLLFQTMATAHFPEGAAWLWIWVAHFIGFTIVWIAGTIVMRRIFKRDARAGVVGGTAAAYTNAFVLGIPLVVTAYGEDALAPISLIVAAQLPLLMVLGAVLIERALIVDGVEGAVPTSIWKTIGVNAVTNPFIIGIVLGLLWRLTGVPLPWVAATIVDRIAEIAGTLALIALGMGLRKYGISGNVQTALALSALKLIAMPAIALFVVLYIVPLPEVWAKVAVIVAACPSGNNVFVVASRFRTGEALAANTVILTTGLAVLSMSVWLNVVELLI
jgi:predicted permease